MNRRQYGMTLIELMVALAIGAFLMIGAITVFMQSRTTFRVTESLSRLQENARFALEAIEPDIRMAHYWGLTSRTNVIAGRPPPTAGASIGTGACGSNADTRNLTEAVEGDNGGYSLGCNEFGGAGNAAADADTLVVRRVSEDPVAALSAGTIYIQSTRGAQGGALFTGTTIPPDFAPATSATHRLIVNGYYVDQSSSVAGLPSLRRKSLQPGGGLIDEEIMVGVEDMQIQFGVDTDAPGTAVVPNPNRGAVDIYVNPDDPMIDPTNAGFNPNAEILAVRVWLRLRAERFENGLADTTDYEYADEDFGTFNDQIRRIVVSKTIYLRNARPAS
jgi:type IV pilus assembly protein PilW